MNLRESREGEYMGAVGERKERRGNDIIIF